MNKTEIINELESQLKIVRQRRTEIELKYPPGHGIHKTTRLAEQADKAAWCQHTDTINALQKVLLSVYDHESD